MKCLELFIGIFCLFFLNTISAEDPVPCDRRNATCEECVKNSTCMWCKSAVLRCMPYPVNHVLPTKDDCALSDARWGVCWLNFEAMIISVSIIGGLLLITMTICICKCCKCCCFKKNRRRYEQEVARMEAQRESRKMRQDERRQNRKMRNDEIRRKYGLTTSEPQYNKFDNE